MGLEGGIKRGCIDTQGAELALNIEGKWRHRGKSRDGKLSESAKV